MPITTDSTTPVSSMALKNWSIPAVSWTKLRKWRWLSTSSCFASLLLLSIASTAEEERRNGGIVVVGASPYCPLVLRPHASLPTVRRFDTGRFSDRSEEHTSEL